MTIDLTKYTREEGLEIAEALGYLIGIEKLFFNLTIKELLTAFSLSEGQKMFKKIADASAKYPEIFDNQKVLMELIKFINEGEGPTH